MTLGITPDRLELTEEEALTLLSLCMLSEANFDAESEKAIRKLADFCRSHTHTKRNRKSQFGCELSEAG